ncbi:MAG: ROK family protein [Chloroflexota bacterium]
MAKYVARRLGPAAWPDTGKTSGVERHIDGRGHRFAAEERSGGGAAFQGDASGDAEHNVRLVLRALANLGPISRADIARRTRLTRTTVSDVVSQLSGAGLVQEVGRGPSSGGKAPILLQIPRDARQLIGVHVGDGHVRSHRQPGGRRVPSRAGRAVAATAPRRSRASTCSSTGSSAMRTACRWASASARRASWTPPAAPSAGPSISTGVTCVWGLDWKGPHGPTCLRGQRLQAAALAEWTFGGHTTARAMVAVRVGTGIGAGIVIDDRLYQGDGAGAGEIGHTPRSPTTASGAAVVGPAASRPSPACRPRSSASGRRSAPPPDRTSTRPSRHSAPVIPGLSGAAVLESALHVDAPWVRSSTPSTSATSCSSAR